MTNTVMQRSLSLVVHQETLLCNRSCSPNRTENVGMSLTRLPSPHTLHDFLTVSSILGALFQFSTPAVFYLPFTFYWAVNLFTNDGQLVVSFAVNRF